MFLPVIGGRRALSNCSSKQNVTLTLLHHTKSFLIIIKRNRCRCDGLHIQHSIRFSADGEKKILNYGKAVNSYLFKLISEGRISELENHAQVLLGGLTTRLQAGGER